MALKFGTSGLRGLDTELTDQECYLYTKAFVKHLLNNNLFKDKKVALTGDNRPSTPRIMNAVACAFIDNGFEVIYYETIPIPAVSFYGYKLKIPSIMITGSHIPDYRNGIKFNLIDGEILKRDEEGITKIYNELKESSDSSDLFKPDTGEITKAHNFSKQDNKAEEEFVNRYLDIFPLNYLKNK